MQGDNLKIVCPLCAGTNWITRLMPGNPLAPVQIECDDCGRDGEDLLAVRFTALASPPVSDGCEFVMVPRELREMSERAAVGPWEVDGEPNEDGEYGPGPDPGRGFDDYAIFAAEGGKILGTEDATHKSIEEEIDDEGYKAAWDQIGRDNARFAAAAVNFVRDLLAASPSRPSPSPEHELQLKSDTFRAGFMAATRYNWERAEGMEEDYRENALTEWLTTPPRPT